MEALFKRIKNGGFLPGGAVIIVPKREDAESYMKGESRCIRDWSLIRGRGGYKMGKSRVRNFLRPPPQDRIKLFAPPL